LAAGSRAPVVRKQAWQNTGEQRGNAQLKTTFWPMVRGVGEGFAVYVINLRHVREHAMDRAELVRWLISEFHLAESYKERGRFAPLRTGLAESKDGRCVLSRTGEQIVDEGKPNLSVRHLR
jgi:hypothetical protein